MSTSLVSWQSSTNLPQLQIAIDVLSTTTLGCTKLSALLFYRRVLCVGGRTQWFNLATTITIIIVILWLVVFQFLTGFQCGTHLSPLWDGTYLQYCTISFPFLYGLAVSDFLLDVWILAMPIPLVCSMRSQASRRNRDLMSSDHATPSSQLEEAFGRWHFSSGFHVSALRFTLSITLTDQLTKCTAVSARQSPAWYNI